MGRLTFTERGHRYSLDGEWVPSVTSATSVLDKPALRAWYARQAAQWAASNPDQLTALGHDTFVDTACGAPQRAMNAAAGKGTDLHAHAQQLATTGATDAPEDQWPYVEAAADFLDTHQVETLASEAFCFHDTFSYAGRLDLLATLSDGALWLLDFKTGSGVYPDVALQLAAYRYASHLVKDLAADDEQMPPIARCGVVWVRPEGWQLIPVNADREAWTGFLSCLALYQFTKRKADTILGAPMPRPAA